VKKVDSGRKPEVTTNKPQSIGKKMETTLKKQEIVKKVDGGSKNKETEKKKDNTKDKKKESEEKEEETEEKKRESAKKAPKSKLMQKVMRELGINKLKKITAPPKEEKDKNGEKKKKKEQKPSSSEKSSSKKDSLELDRKRKRSPSPEPESYDSADSFINDDDPEEYYSRPENVSKAIAKLFPRRGYFDDRDDSLDDVEARYDDIEREEMRSLRLARLEDEKEAELERQEQLKTLERKKGKVSNKGDNVKEKQVIQQPQPQQKKPAPKKILKQVSNDIFG